ncbi:hypothetical protein [Bradyrhizobium sp. STM 3557]|uniref:hypothetical protein n=1 Tax=Bradyrhizobium sp. STM 3557 TaxID=578920 RepID=UPI00388F6199
MVLRFSLPILASLALNCASAFSQVVAPPQSADAAFKGIGRHKGLNGGAETVTISDGKTYLRITEQEYREHGYAPEFEHLPTIFVQRLPVRVLIPPGDLD